MNQFFANGIVVQREHADKYRGIDGDNWFLGYVCNDSFIVNYYKDNIDLAATNSNYVDCCNDLNYIIRYLRCSDSLGIKTRLLYCETPHVHPRFCNHSKLELSFLGYDYAYPGGEYYSCILNDILSRRVKELNNLKLNKNNLFNTFDEIVSFIEHRTVLVNQYPKYFFEGGDFIIYRLFEAVLQSSEDGCRA